MLEFAPSARSTLGVEWELQLIDRDSLDLRQSGDVVLSKVREYAAALSAKQAEFVDNIHGEMLLNTVELVSNPRATVKECLTDLRGALDLLSPVIEPMRIELASAGTHPFANPAYQRVTDNERYNKIVERTRYWGRQMLLFGTHVHVGIERRELVLPVIRALLTRFAHLQALTAASPYWNGLETGYADNRAMVFQQLPTAGVPHQFATWEELEQYYADMLKTGVIDGFSEIRWDIRPSPKFGTIELRVCDAASNLTEVAMVAALSQCLVEFFVRKAEAGEELPVMQPWYVDENKWRAARYGMDAILILDADGREELVTDTVRAMVDELMPIAVELGCDQELSYVYQVLETGAPYQRILRAAKNGADSREAVVEHLLAEMSAGKPID